MAATAADIRAAVTGFHGQHMMDWPLLEWHINDDEIAKSRQIKADKAEQKSQSVTSLDWLALEYPIVYLCRRPHTIRKVKFVSKNSILTKLSFLIYLNFCAKIGRHSSIFHPKQYQIIDFSCQKSTFWPKIELKKYRKKPILTNFRGQKFKVYQFFWHFEFKILCQIGFKNQIHFNVSFP